MPQGIPITQVATCCTESEFAEWTTRSTRTRRKNILWPPNRIAEFQGNLLQQRWLQNTRQAYLTLQSNNRTRIAKKRSKSWFSSSRITRTRSLFCRTWARLKRLVRSAKGRRCCSPTWAIRRSSSFAKPLPRNNTPTVFYIGSLASYTVHVEEVQNPRKGPNSSTRRTVTLYQFPPHPWCSNMELPNGNECTTRPRRCCRKTRQPKQTWWLRNHSGKMGQRWQIPPVFVRCWVDWGADCSVWWTCIGRPL